MNSLRNSLLPRFLVVFTPALSLTASQANAEGLFSSGILTGDTTSGVTTSKTYTALANVAGPIAVVNGVTFEAGAASGTNWALTGIDTIYTTNGNKTTTFASSTIDELFTRFRYNGKPGTISLTGLTPGKTYVTTLYCQGWSWPNAANRYMRMKGSEGPGTLVFNEDAVEASMVRYTFVAGSASATVTPYPLSPDSFHLYGFSNEEVFNHSWTGGADWTTASWTPTGAPNGVGTNANFPAQGSPTLINLDASQTVGHLQFDGANPWNLSTSNSSILTLETDPAGLSVIGTPSGSHVISTPLSLNSDVMKTGVGTLTLGGAVTGTKGITVTGGVLRFDQSPAYTGVTTLETGTTLDLNGKALAISSLAGTGTVLNDGGGTGTFTVGAGKFSGTIADQSSGGGIVSLTKDGSGIFTLTSPQTYSGATVVAGGTLRLEPAGGKMFADNFNEVGTNPVQQELNYNLSPRQSGTQAPQNWTKTGSNGQVGNATNIQQPASTSGEYMLLSGTTASLQGMPLTSENVTGPLKISFEMFKGLIAADMTNWTAFSFRNSLAMQPNTVVAGEIGFLYRKNSGIQLFSGSGAALVDLASTTAGDNFAFYIADESGTGSAFGQNGSRLVVTQGGGVIADQKLGAAMTTRYINFGLSTSVTGGVDNIAVSQLQPGLLPASASVSLTSATSVLQLENTSQTLAHLDGVAGSTVSIGPFSRLTFAGTSGNSFGGNITGTRGGITKTGSDELTLSGTNTYTGETTIASGTLTASGGAAIADSGSVNLADAADAVFNLTADETIGGLLGGGSTGGRVTLGANHLTVGGNNNSTTFAGVISGTGGVTKTGTGALTLAGSNNYSGTTTIAAGSLILGAGESSGSLSPSSAIINNGNLTINRNDTVTQGSDFGPITGSGSFTHAGLGTVILNAASYTGNTSVTGATLTVANNSASTFADTSTVRIDYGSTLNLPNDAVDVIASLVIDGVALPAGVIYDSTSPETTGYITGSGKLQVGVLSSYQAWADDNVNGEAENLDTDNDGVPNGVEYFMNAPAGFTANPSLQVSDGPVRTVAWTNGGNIPSEDYGTQFVVQTSTDLSGWDTIAVDDPNLANTAGSVAYTLPNTPDKLFVRLLVTPD